MQKHPFYETLLARRIPSEKKETKETMIKAILLFNEPPGISRKEIEAKVHDKLLDALFSERLGVWVVILQVNPLWKILHWLVRT